jgi:hypothetical protein
MYIVLCMKDEIQMRAVCPRCSVTVAAVANEADLVLKEEHHVCDPFLVAHYEFFGKMSRAQTPSRPLSL